MITRVVFRQEVNPLNPYASTTLNCGSEEPFVTEVATSTCLTPRHAYRAYDCFNPLPAHRPACTIRPSVIFFGRSESWRHGYAFTHPR